MHRIVWSGELSQLAPTVPEPRDKKRKKEKTVLKQNKQPYYLLYITFAKKILIVCPCLCLK